MSTLQDYSEDDESTNRRWLEMRIKEAYKKTVELLRSDGCTSDQIQQADTTQARLQQPGDEYDNEG